MKRYLFLFLAATIYISSGCSNGQSQTSETNLPPKEFLSKINQTQSPEILDVRTPEEFSKGHLANARNIDWNSNDFQDKVSGLDKSKPVFVYCLSGKRSAAAASLMRSEGFKQVYELNGGIMKWRAENLPETPGNTSTSKGLSQQQFNELLNSDRLVLIDFYADWCPPCKKMKPYLEEISKEMTDKVIVIPINADENQELCKELKIDALPVLQLYKNKKLIWTNTGFISKEEVVKQLED